MTAVLGREVGKTQTTLGTGMKFYVIIKFKIFFTEI